MEDIVGKKYGRLKVLSQFYDGKKHTFCFAECICNQSVIVRKDHLVHGTTKSCGCLKKLSSEEKERRRIEKERRRIEKEKKKERRRIEKERKAEEGIKERKRKIKERLWKHGHCNVNGKRTPTYGSWFNMKQRCLNSNNPAYKRYGGRGIMVCERWMVFENFLADMGERPKDKTLDRIDNDGHYEPSNCRWATRKQQANNTNANIDLIEKEKQRKKELAQRRKESEQRKKEKLEKPLFKMNGYVVPFDYLKKNGRMYYKVLCKCRKVFLVDKYRIHLHNLSCTYCREKNHQGTNTTFIKVKYTDKLKKAFDVLYDNGYIKTKKLAHIVRL